jgi:tetratricopeptide (TPR) repeat protein
MRLHCNFAKTALCCTMVLSLFSLGIRAGQDARDVPGHETLGLVSFPTTCRADVQKEFERGVALLHSFAYSSAEETFKSVAVKDSNCALAHWGVAMSYFHELWDPPIGADALSQGFGEMRRAQQIGTGSDRERRFIGALALVYEQDAGAVPYRRRVAEYEGAMGRLATAHPNDVESQVFYALALLASASPFDKAHANQKRAVNILEPLVRKYPRHPGIAHYLIHACDNQEMAQQGLAASRLYSKIAPSAPHALHMPSHIFTRLGMWSDSIASNEAARAAARSQGDVGEELHAMDYLMYAYLQEGREKEAHTIIQELRTMPNLDPRDFKAAYASVAMPVRYAIERRRWSDAANIPTPTGVPPQVTAIAVWARGIGLARTGHPSQARVEVETLRRLEEQLRASGSPSGEYWAKQVQTQSLEVLAWSAQAEDKPPDARGLMQQAADQEDSIEKLPVTPGPIIPAREQLGDLLLQQNQPALALKEFQTVLANAPNRRGAITGARRSRPSD